MTAESVSPIRPLFTYCPYDATALTPVSDLEGTLRPTCRMCGFVDYRNPKPCVEALVEQDGRLLLGRRAIEPAKGMWDILGGFMQVGETVEEALQREVLEESGLEVRMTCFLGSHVGVYGRQNEPILVLCFAAESIGGALRPATDVAELRWFSPYELPGPRAFPHQRAVLEAGMRRTGWQPG